MSGVIERLKCSVCGAELTQLSPTEYVCEYCDNRFTVKEEIPEDTVILMNIAAMELRNKAFSRARNAYSKIIADGGKIAEVFWCSVLSKYGIEYVKDISGKYVPTCHRISTQSVLSDSDYLSALRYAGDPEDYQKKAEEIERIRKEILSVAEQNEPYEVFICYKQDDENGKPTTESLFATDVYNRLTGLGVKVFLARKCIPAGKPYEPYIYNALETSKVMLLMCGELKYIESTWVSNEWERYIDMIKLDSTRILVPIFDGFNPYDLPEDLAKLRLQGLQRGDLDFTDKLISMLEKKLGRRLRSTKTEEEKEKELLAKERLFSRAQAALLSKNYARARERYEDYLEEYPHDYRGWLGMIKVCTKNYADYEAADFDYFLRLALDVANPSEQQKIMNEVAPYSEAKRKDAEEKLMKEKQRQEDEKNRLLREQARQEELRRQKEEERRRQEAIAAEQEKLLAEAREKALRELQEQKKRQEEELRRQKEEERRRQEAIAAEQEKLLAEAREKALRELQEQKKRKEEEQAGLDADKVRKMLADNIGKGSATGNKNKRPAQQVPSRPAPRPTPGPAAKGNGTNVKVNDSKIRGLFSEEVEENESRRLRGMLCSGNDTKPKGGLDKVKELLSDEPSQSKRGIADLFADDVPNQKNNFAEQMRNFFKNE